MQCEIVQTIDTAVGLLSPCCAQCRGPRPVNVFPFDLHYRLAFKRVVVSQLLNHNAAAIELQI